MVSSQVDLHALYGGVVPELAGRAHLELLTPVIADALARAGARRAPDLDAVAATIGPGLIGSLLVGVSEAKALALAWDLPFVGVNHLEGHLFAALLEHPDIEWPVVVLLVSGGHTLLVSMEGPGRYRLLGQTLDDAAGEAFDKVARFLGLGYPGGPAIERGRHDGRPRAPSPSPGPCWATASTSPSAGSRRRSSTPCAGAPRGLATRTWPPPSSRPWSTCSWPRPCGAAVSVGARGICLAGGVAANGAAAPGRSPRPARELGLPAYLPQPGHVHRQRGHDRRRGLVAARARGPDPARRRRRSQPPPAPPRLSARRARRAPVARGRGARYR